MEAADAGDRSKDLLDHVGLFRRTQDHDRRDRPDLETRADGRLLSVRPNADRDRRSVAGRHPTDGQRIRQADRRAGLSPRRGGRSLAASDRGSAVWQSRLGGVIDMARSVRSTGRAGTWSEPYRSASCLPRSKSIDDTKALGFTVPASLVVRADQVIE